MKNQSKKGKVKKRNWKQKWRTSMSLSMERFLDGKRNYGYDGDNIVMAGSKRIRALSIDS